MRLHNLACPPPRPLHLPHLIAIPGGSGAYGEGDGLDASGLVRGLLVMQVVQTKVSHSSLPAYFRLYCTHRVT